MFDHKGSSGLQSFLSSFLASDPAPSQPAVLTSRTLPAVAMHILSPSTTKIHFLVGAGISTSAGIPDFRTPGTGLYSSLSSLRLPYPEAVFDLSFFLTYPLPFYTLAHSLWPGKFTPTLTHAFMALIHHKGKLGTVFTQNIDTLELAAGLPKNKVVFAHGSFASQSCTACRIPAEREDMEIAVRTKTPARCRHCNGLVKPDIVFFGEQLPQEFHARIHVLENADLVVVMGSSLSVMPFAALPQRVGEGVPRLLINREMVGGIGGRRDDVVLEGDCDAGVRRLAKLCGWEEELVELWRRMGGREKEEEKGLDGMGDEDVAREVEKLSQEVEEGLKVNEAVKSYVEEGILKGLRKRNEVAAASGMVVGNGVGVGLGKYERSEEEGGLDHVFPHLKKDRED